MLHGRSQWLSSPTSFIFWHVAVSIFSFCLQRRSQTAAVLKYFTCVCTAVPEICVSAPSAVSKYFSCICPELFVSGHLLYFGMWPFKFSLFLQRRPQTAAVFKIFYVYLHGRSRNLLERPRGRFKLFSCICPSIFRQRPAKSHWPGSCVS